MLQNLMVYGTLRKGGLAQHKLQGLFYQQIGLRLPGFAMFDAGWYPLAVKSDSDSIVADLIKIPEELFPQIDAYEGEEYERLWLAEQAAWLYVYRREIKTFPKVSSGDWLTYWQEKRKGS